MKTLTTLVVGAALGFGLAQFIGKAKKQFIRLDEVTLKRTELDHVIRAINLLKDRPAEPATWQTRAKLNSSAQRRMPAT